VAGVFLNRKNIIVLLIASNWDACSPSISISVAFSRYLGDISGPVLLFSVILTWPVPTAAIDAILVWWLANPQHRSRDLETLERLRQRATLARLFY